jgi:large subunit ribosomal protein L25
MPDLVLTVEYRDVNGKKVSTLRNEGITPVHMYGPGIDPRSLQCDTALVDKIVSEAGGNIPVTINLAGEDDEVCFIREVQYHPVKDVIIHVDFMKVDVTKEVEAQVPVIIQGTSPAVRNLGGTLLQPLQAVTVRALPMEIPAQLTLKAEVLVDYDTNLYVRDLVDMDSVAIINDESELIASVVPPRIEREDTVVGIEGEDGSEEEVDGDEESESDDEE